MPDRVSPSAPSNGDTLRALFHMKDMIHEKEERILSVYTIFHKNAIFVKRTS